jgi:type IV pilus assembly protein PilN
VIRINLLPHREVRRKQQQQQFFVLLAFVVVVGGAVWFVVRSYLDEQFQTQQARNKYLQDEVVKLDKQIAEIQKLKEQTAALLARKRVVETLQSNRAEVVHLLDQLVRQLPDGVYLKALKQTGSRVTITGLTESQARVSTLMRNLESSSQLEKPGLVEIKAVQQNRQRVNEFIMNITITRTKTEEVPGKAARKPPAKK